jgi:SAM-dependent methyltransferase
MEPISSRFLGRRGEEYQANRAGRMVIRLYQLEMYFTPYVSGNDVVLDVGANDGLFLRHLPARRRIGIEVNEAARRECTEASGLDGTNIELYEDMSAVESDSVDVVISNHCLEHTVDPFLILSEIKRVLKSDRRFILVVPFDDWRSPTQRAWIPNDRDNHLFTWSPRNIGNLLAEAGFAVEEVRFCRIATSRKLWWLRRILGDGAFRAACHMFAVYKNKGETFIMARKPS